MDKSTQQEQKVVLHALPEGKPDPKNPGQKKIFSGQKGDTCWFYALRTLELLTLNENSDPEYRHNRKILSTWRKAYTQIDIDHSLMVELILGNLVEISEGKVLTRECVKQIGISSVAHSVFTKYQKTLHNIQEIQEKENVKPRSLTERAKDKYRRYPEKKYYQLTLADATRIVAVFCLQNKIDNLIDYIKHIAVEKQFAVLKKCFRELQIADFDDLENKFPGSKLFNLNETYKHFASAAYRNAPVFDQLYFGLYLLRNIAADLFGQLVLQHDFTQNINFLADLLYKIGPIVVIGNFGKTYYVNEPEMMAEKISNQTIFKWTPGSKKISSQVMHDITIVGVKTNPQNADQSQVFYADPLDESIPKPDNNDSVGSEKGSNLNSGRPYYCMSFKSLREGLHFTNSWPLKNVKDGPLTDRPSHYGYFNPSFGKK